MTVELRSDIAALWRGRDPFRVVSGLQGELYRHREGRRTLRVELDGRPFFLKEHRGVGWGEIAKNLTQVRLPVLGAEREYHAIRRLEAVGIDTLAVAAFGARGRNPARRHSFLLTDELTGMISLEELGESWRARPGGVAFKRSLIRRVAEIARRMHDAGVNHRDFYLCHFLLPETEAQRENPGTPLHLIDMHRSRLRARLPERWRIKDLGGLYFSVARLGFSRRDLLRFVRAYEQRPLRAALNRNARRWDRTRREGERIYARYFEVQPRFPLQFAEHPGKDI
jgi:heptose I phosphotransferase